MTRKLILAIFFISLSIMVSAQNYTAYAGVGTTLPQGDLGEITNGAFYNSLGITMWSYQLGIESSLSFNRFSDIGAYGSVGLSGLYKLIPETDLTPVLSIGGRVYKQQFEPASIFYEWTDDLTFGFTLGAGFIYLPSIGSYQIGAQINYHNLFYENDLTNFIDLCVTIGFKK